MRDNYSKMTSLIKVYEALGYIIPFLIVDGFSETGEFVEKEDIGFIVKYSAEEVKKTILDLYYNRNLLERTKENILKIQKEHTWESRAKYAAEILTGEVQSCI